MLDFHYKEIDVDGQATLEAIDKADNFNEWMYQTIKPYCKGKVLEIGSGIGNITRYFIRDHFDITCSDLRMSYCEVLIQKFPNSNIVELDLIDPDFDNKFSSLLGTFDTVYALNVVEHIKDDNLAISNAKKLLKHDGNIIILVPAYQALYNRFDIVLEHYRRYNEQRLNSLLSNHFTLIHSQYFNFIGIFGWFFSGSILKKKTVPAGPMSLFNKLVLLFKMVDKLLMNTAGLSVISVGKK